MINGYPFIQQYTDTLRLAYTMDACQGNSSRVSSTGAGRDNEHKQVEQPAVGAAAAVPSYCLFPEDTARGQGGLQLYEIFTASRQQPNLEADPKATTAEQSHLPVQASRQLPTLHHGGIHSSSSEARGTQDTGLNAHGQMSTTQNLAHVPAPFFGGQISGVLGNIEQDPEEVPPLSKDAIKTYGYLIGVHVAYFRVCLDPNVASSGRLLQQAMQDLKNHCACDALVAHYENTLAEADVTIIQQQSTPSVVLQHHGASEFNNMTPSVHRQEIVAPVMSSTLRLMNIKGKVAASCAERKGSRFVQKAIEVATPQEILMVYEEITPCVRTLAVDVFGNHAIQKILEHGPQSCKRMVISNLIGHVVPLSLDKFSCRVIQKAFDVGEHDQKLVMAKELSTKVLKCVHDQYANHVIQKCIECLPANDIHFILQSFCGRARALSTHFCGCHVIQKVLAHCSDNQEIFSTLTAEIIEYANKLSADKFGNYVVQQLLELGDHAMRSTMVRKFAGRVVSMSYHRYASNVVEKCLAVGSREDRRLIADEIIGAGAGDGQHFEHLVDMMINPHANFVIQNMLVTAEEQQVGLLLEVARSNTASLTRYPHGRHVVDCMKRFVSAQGTHADPALCRR